MDFSTFFTITLVAILSSGIGYSFYAVYQIRKLQSEIQRLAKQIRNDFNSKRS
jgi:hypothetical protein